MTNLSNVTQPLDSGKETSGFDTLMGLKENLQPKLRAESLMKEIETMGLSKMWMGSM